MGRKCLFGDSKPVHPVSLSEYRMGATPVTVAVWKEYCEATRTKLPWAPSWGLADNHPIVNVSWYDIMGDDGLSNFCAWASEIAGESLTLPSEAQFEYASLGGIDGQKYPWGNSFDRSKCWCSTSNYHDAGHTTPVDRTVHTYCNAYGLTDMTGNVWQWCSDFYGSYGSSLEVNPTGPSSSTNQHRCVRSESWIHFKPSYFRCANRHGFDPEDKRYDLGFRLVAPA